jgi:hypothetical protein
MQAKEFAFYTADDFLNQLKAELKVSSDYELAKVLGMRQQRISNYRNGTTRFDGQMCRRIEHILRLPRGTVGAWAMAERAARAKQEEDRTYWQDILKRLGGTAAAVALAVGLAPPPAPPGDASTVYYVKSRRRSWLPVLVLW